MFQLPGLRAEGGMAGKPVPRACSLCKVWQNDTYRRGEFE